MSIFSSRQGADDLVHLLHTEERDSGHALPGIDGRLPQLRSTYGTDIDAIEQHAHLHCVELDVVGSGAHGGKTKSKTLEPLVVQNEAPTIPEQNLDPVMPFPDERKEVAGERIEMPVVAYDREEPVVATASADVCASRFLANTPPKQVASEAPQLFPEASGSW